MLQGLEVILTWQEIIKYREWALVELRIEAKRFMLSGIEVKSNSLSLTDIWVRCVNAEEIKLKNKESEFRTIEDIELSFMEKTSLYEILATDKNKTLISFMDGDFIERGSIAMDLNIEVYSISILLTELISAKNKHKNNEITQHQFQNLCKCSLCVQKKGSVLLASILEQVPLQDDNNSPENMDQMGAKNPVNPDLQKRDQGELFAPHLRDINHNVLLTDQNEASLGNKRTLKPPNKSTEKLMSSDNLSVICFIEILGFMAHTRVMTDGSFLSKSPYKLENFIIFDPTIFPEVNSENECNFVHRSVEMYFLKNSFEPLPDRLGMGEKNLAKSNILSMILFEMILRMGLSDNHMFSDFLEKMNCRHFNTFFETFMK
jgi:hypothetical protein